jgi:hypothetical protein
MSMQGMSMPGSTTEVCKAAGTQEAPIPTEKNCQTYDAKRTGNTFSFKMRCTGKDAMEGSGEMTFLGSDHYKGAMNVNAQGAQMTMNYEGNKIGTCDYAQETQKRQQMIADINQKAAKAQKDGEQIMKQAQEQQREVCVKMTTEARSPAALMSCKEPQDLKNYCTNFQKHGPFLAQSDMQRTYAKAGQSSMPDAKPLDESAKLCKVSVEPLREKLCRTAESEDKLNFLARECPVLAAEVAKVQCAGRKYSSEINAKYRGFCASFASTDTEDSGSNATSAQPQTPEKKPGLLGKGKKALGDLFSH